MESVGTTPKSRSGSRSRRVTRRTRKRIDGCKDMKTIRYRTYLKQIGAKTKRTATALGREVGSGATPDRRTIEDLDKFIEDGAADAYKRPWNRIEKGFRINRVKDFVKRERHARELSKTAAKVLYVLLHKRLSAGELSRKRDLDYDAEKGRVIKIHRLEFDPKSKKYSFRASAAKTAKKTVRVAGATKRK